MESFKNMMTDTKFLLPNWSWIAIALVVVAAIIIIACSVVAGRKKKSGRNAEESTALEQPQNGEQSAVENDFQDGGIDRLIEPFYPAPDKDVIHEGATEGSSVAEQSVGEPVQVSIEEVYEEKPAENSAPAEADTKQPAEEIEYRSEQVGEPVPVDEVTYSAVVTPVGETAAEPAKKTTAKKTATKKTTAKKPAAKKPAAKKAAAKKPVAKKTVQPVKEEVKEEPAVEAVKSETKPEAAPKKAAAKKPAAKKPAAEKPTEKKPATGKTRQVKAAKPKPAKDDSVPKVSDVLTEDIPAPVRTEPEVLPEKPVAKQTVLKTEDKKEAPKKAAAKKAETAKAEPAKSETKKPAVKKAAAVKPAAKKPAAAKAAKVEIADVSQKVARSTPKGPEKVYHVSRRPQDNKWEVRLEGSSKAIKLFRTKAEAMDFAIPLAGDDSDNSRVIIHKADGRPKNVAFL